MTTVTLIPTLIQQFFDNTGHPASGGSVLTQVGGINAPTYSDSAGLNVLPNPIPLNSRGELAPAPGNAGTPVFIPINTVYTFTLFDSAGNQLSQDPYVFQGAFVPTQASLGAIFYPRTAAEIAAGVTPTSFVYPELNVLRYGADPTALTDSTTAVNNAIAVAIQKAKWATQPSLTFNAAVYFPTGWYLVGSTGTFVTIGSSPVLLKGDGPQASMIINGSTNQPAVSINGGGGQFYGGLDGLGFGTAAGVSAVAGNCAIKIVNYTEFVLRNLGLYNYPALPYEGLVITNGQQYKVSDVQVQGAITNNIHLTQGGYGVWTNVQSDDGAPGWLLDNQVKLYLVNCGAFGSFGQGWSLNSTNPSTNPNLNNEFVNCMSDSSKGHNWNIGDSVLCTFTNCWGCTQKDSSTPTACGFFINTANVHDCVFTSCTASNNSQDGFQLASTPSKLSFVNCMAGQSGEGNGTGAGGGYGYNISNGTTTVRILGGQIQSNVTGPINFNGASVFVNSIVVRDTGGFATCGNNTASVVIGTSVTTVSHGLPISPTGVVIISPTSSLAASGISSWWVTNFTATTFDVHTNASVSGANWTFNWRASLNEQ